jgi:sulfate adenylyltransferase subunit 2
LSRKQNRTLSPNRTEPESTFDQSEVFYFCHLEQHMRNGLENKSNFPVEAGTSVSKENANDKYAKSSMKITGMEQLGESAAVLAGAGRAGGEFNAGAESAGNCVCEYSVADLRIWKTSRRVSGYLASIEAASIEIIREAVALASKPVMTYSIGKDSSVLLHLARKAFWPAAPPFPLLHIDTTWKFREMIAFRDRIAAESGMTLLVHTNRKRLQEGVSPFTHDSGSYTTMMKTEALKQALDAEGFDIILGGARRDEERSRAKERIFSFRSAGHRWDPKLQRPELWNLYNARIHDGETIRVFPLSNWTEADIWQYIEEEKIHIVQLYFAAPRPVVKRSGQWIMVDDERFPLHPGEEPEMRTVRFRTLGCYPLTAAIESSAVTVSEIVQETLAARTSERQGRLIDFDQVASMERKKQEGYF